MLRSNSAALALAACLVSAPALAQAPASAAPATPRWPDGRVNLGSTPDQKGFWEIRPGLGGTPRAADIPLQPWARALAAYRTSRTDLHPPLVRCKPGGGPAFFNAPGFEIVDVPEERRIYLLNIAGAHSWRVIYMDGRAHPAADVLRPSYFGHSIGRWEGDTLVVDTVGFNEKQWLVGVYPTTERLHLTERFTRSDLRTLTYEATVDDPGAYTKPWSLKWTISASSKSQWIPGGEIFEYICQGE